jgi:hypothetical protein
MVIETLGALAFGAVVGWVAYRTIRRTKTSGLSDISAVIAAVGGGAVTSLFPSGSQAFGAYGLGLAAGFFSYLVVSLIIAAKTEGLKPANEWLGEPQSLPVHAARSPQGNGIPPVGPRPQELRQADASS